MSLLCVGLFSGGFSHFELMGLFSRGGMRLICGIYEYFEASNRILFERYLNLVKN